MAEEELAFYQPVRFVTKLTGKMTALLILLSIAMATSLKVVSKRGLEESCVDWSVDYLRYRVMHGEPVRVRCALFYGYIRSTYTLAVGGGLRLMWYRSSAPSEPEEPIVFDGVRISKEGEAVWFKPAELHDAGLYSCILRNASYCMKVSMALTVAERESGCFNSRLRYSETAELSKSKEIVCPDIHAYTSPGEDTPILWYKECEQLSQRDVILSLPSVTESNRGNYTCQLAYGHFLIRRTTELTVTAPLTEQPPHILFPSEHTLLTMEQGSEVNLTCRAFFGYSGDSASPLIYWMKEEKFIEDLEHITESDVRVLREHLGEQEVAITMTIGSLQQGDLGNYSCYAENANGRRHASILLTHTEVYSVELVVGLGAVLLLMLVLLCVYGCCREDLTLCYRQHFASEDLDGGDKDYDAFLSYSEVVSGPWGQRSGQMSPEEELFAREVLPAVLERHYGYKLLIPDRDLTHPGTCVEDVSRYVERSRRLIVAMTPEYARRRGWSLFQREAGLWAGLVSGATRVILIEAGDLRGYAAAEAELRSSVRSLAVIRWHGESSSQPGSTFWKRVVMEMPFRRHPARTGYPDELQAISMATAAAAAMATAQPELRSSFQSSHYSNHDYERNQDYSRNHNYGRNHDYSRNHDYGRNHDYSRNHDYECDYQLPFTTGVTLPRPYDPNPLTLLTGHDPDPKPLIILRGHNPNHSPLPLRGCYLDPDPLPFRGRDPVPKPVRLLRAPPRRQLSLDQPRHSNHATLHSNHATLHRSNTTLHHSNTTLHHNNNATLHRSNATIYHSNGTLHHSNATLHRSNSAALHHSNARLHHSNAGLHHSNTTVHHSNATLHHSNKAALYHSNAALHQSNAGLHHSNATMHHSNVTLHRSKNGTLPLLPRQSSISSVIW